MTLLTSMLERPLDPGYQEAADRRVSAGLPPATPMATVIVVVMLVLTGFLFAVGAKALRPAPTAATGVKTELVQRIESLQAHGLEQEKQIEALGREVRRYESLALQQSGLGALTEQISRLEAAAGAIALHGPGLTLTLDDAANTRVDADAGVRPDGGFAEGRVTSADLQIIVNGLWAARAEAISINGHRLTTTAAIRFAGQAIIVDFRPLSRPYVITAIGPADTMLALFEPSFAGLYLGQLQAQYGIPATWATASELRVPASSSHQLTAATPLRPSTAGSGTAPDDTVQSTTMSPQGGSP